MYRLTPLPLILALTACGPPNLQPELDAFARDAKSANAALAAYAKPLAAQETERKRREILAAGDPVVSLTEGCATYRARDPGARLSACRVIDIVPHARNGVWSAALEFSAELDAYLAAFQTLVDASSPTEIGMASTRLLSAVGELAEATGDAGGAADIAKRADPVGALATRIAEARRRAALHKAAAQVDPAIRSNVKVLVDEMTKRSPEVAARYGDLVAAAKTANETKPQTQAAINRLTQAHAAYVAAENRLPVRSLLALRDAHGALLAAVSRGASRAEILGLLDDLNALKSTL